MIPPQHDSPTRRQARGLGAVGGALLASAVAGYVFVALVSRLLAERPDVLSRFLAIWGVLFGFGAMLSVVEQESSRLSALAAAQGRRHGNDLTRVVAMATLIVLMTHAIVLLTPLGRSWYGGRDTQLVALAVATSSVGFIGQFWVRGTLIGHDDRRAYAWVIVGEAALRLLGLGVLVLAGGVTLGGLVLATVAGSFAWLPFVPRALRHGRGGAGQEALTDEGWSSVTRTTFTLGLGTGCSAILLTGYPALVTAVLGSPAGLATLFVVVTATRVPLVLVAPLQAIAIPTLVRAIHEGGASALRPFLSRGLVLLVAAILVGAPVAWCLGPSVVRVMFGSTQHPAGSMVAILAVATILIAGAQLICAALVAMHRAGLVAVTWGVGAGTAAISLTVGHAATEGDPAHLGAWGLLIASACSLTASLIAARRAAPLLPASIERTGCA